MSGDRAGDPGVLERKPAPETDQRPELGGERARHGGALSARERQELGQPEQIEVGLCRTETEIVLHSTGQRPAERGLRDVEKSKLLERVVLRREHAANSRMAQLEKAQLRHRRELRRKCAAEARLSQGDADLDSPHLRRIEASELRRDSARDLVPKRLEPSEAASELAKLRWQRTS